MGAWKLNVNNINLKHINRSMRICNYFTTGNKNILEDEEHVIFGCPEYNTCRLKFPELFNLSDNNIIHSLCMYVGMNIGLNPGHSFIMYVCKNVMYVCIWTLTRVSILVCGGILRHPNVPR